jgi:HlyD family secretion protein
MAKPASSKKFWYITGAVVVVLVLAGIIGRQVGIIGGEPAGKEVETAKVGLKTITQLVSASGRINPETEVIISPDVSGEIIELRVVEGQNVKRGDMLLRIKPDIYQAQIDQLNATLSSQKARYEQSKVGFEQSRLNYERQKQLYEKKVISELEFLQAETNYLSEEANLKAAEFQIQNAEASLRKAQEELQQTIIRAPMDGTISKLNVEIGERVVGNMQMSGTEIMRIARLEQMEVEVRVNESDIVNVNVSDSVKIEVDAYPNRTFDGIVTEIANSANITGVSSTEQVTDYTVKIRITTLHNMPQTSNPAIAREESNEMGSMDPSPIFKPGMSASVDIMTETVLNAISVPIQAVTVRDFNKMDSKKDSTATDSDIADTEAMESSDTNNLIPREDLRKLVFVVRDGKAEIMEVTTGISDETHIHITVGLEAGDEVIIGPYRLVSRELNKGDKITVKNNRANLVAQN